MSRGHKAAQCVQDPAAGKEATELRLNMQLTHVLKALKDTSPAVRHVAVAGACAVLSRFWEVIPVQVVAKLATSLQLCAADAASPAVRAAVATSVADLTDNANVRPLSPRCTRAAAWVGHDPRKN